MTLDFACAQANEFIKKTASAAFAEKRKGNTNAAMFLFGAALHTMQDSTSSAHKGFQEWSDNVSTLDTIEHAGSGLFDPFSGSELDSITKKAWDGFKNRNLAAFAISCKCP